MLQIENGWVDNMKMYTSPEAKFVEGIIKMLIGKYENIATVNSEIFARTLFSRNFAYAKFREYKTLGKWQNRFVIY